jgi:hypothetical protein
MTKTFDEKGRHKKKNRKDKENASSGGVWRVMGTQTLIVESWQTVRR